MRVRSLGYVVIAARDLGPWERFATEILGLMRAESSDPDVALFRMDARPFRFRVEKSERDGFVLPGWEFDDEAAWRAVVERLRAAGRLVVEGTRAEARDRCVAAFARSSDPAGYEFEVYHGRVLDYAPFASPAAVSGFVTGEAGGMGLGHVVFAAPNFAEVHAFYRDVLGFGDTDLGHFFLMGGPDDPGIDFAFLHAQNRRHHSLALGELPPNEARCVHMMVEVATLDDVGRALERAEKAGLRISATLGRHVNDKMISFYVRSPGGFDIEYGCHGLEIDPATWITTTSLPVSDWGHHWAPPEA